MPLVSDGFQSYMRLNCGFKKEDEKMDKYVMEEKVKELNAVIDELSTEYGFRYSSPYKVVSVEFSSIAKWIGVVAAVLFAGSLLMRSVIALICAVVVIVIAWVLADADRRIYGDFETVACTRKGMALVEECLKDYKKQLQNHMNLKVELEPLIQRFKILGKFIKRELKGEFRVEAGSYGFNVYGSLYEGEGNTFGYSVSEKNYDELVKEVVKELKRRREQQQVIAEFEAELEKFEKKLKESELACIQDKAD